MSGRIQNKPHMNPYDYHKYLINEYVLLKPGDTKHLQKKTVENYKSDKDIILENMRFIWNEESLPATYEERLAKKYYDKLFREYAICDLSKYKENKIGNRFRVEKVNFLLINSYTIYLVTLIILLGSNCWKRTVYVW